MGFGLGSIGKIASIGSKVANFGSSLAGMAQTTGLIGGSDAWQPSSYEEAVRHMKQGIQWKVKDARKAGVHPLAAIGVPTAGPIVSSGGGASPDYGAAGSRVAGAIGKFDTRAQEAAAAQQARESEARVRVNETQAMLNEARSRSLMSEVRANPTVTAQLLDPSHVKDPSGRLRMFRGADGRWHRVDPNMTPAGVLEEEFGEMSELHNAARLMKGAYEWRGLKGSEGPSASDIIKALRSLLSNP